MLCVLRSLVVVAGTLLMPAAAAAQEIKIGLSAEPSSMDPHYHNLTPNNAFLSHVY